MSCTVDVMSKEVEFCRFIKLSVRQPEVPSAQANCTLKGRTQKPLTCFFIKIALLCCSCASDPSSDCLKIKLENF